MKELHAPNTHTQYNNEALAFCWMHCNTNAVWKHIYARASSSLLSRARRVTHNRITKLIPDERKCVHTPTRDPQGASNKCSALSMFRSATNGDAERQEPNLRYRSRSRALWVKWIKPLISGVFFTKCAMETWSGNARIRMAVTARGVVNRLRSDAYTSSTN